MTTDVTTLPTPPRLPGAPLLGNLVEWRRDHNGLYSRGYRTLGPVFSIRLGPQRGVVLVGPHHHEFYFREVDRTLSVPELYRFVVPMFGDVLMAATDERRRRRHVALVQSAFQGRRLERYGEIMADEVSAWLDGWAADGVFDLWEAVEPLVMRIAARALLGAEIRDRVDEFRPLLVDLARGMEFVLPPNLPLPRFRRRDRARRRLTEMIGPVLAERRRAPGRHNDFLQTLADDPELVAEGTGIQVGMALCTLFTGYITTAAQLAWTLVELLDHPAHLDRVLDELGGDAGARSPALDRAVLESVRLRPVMGHYARTTTTEYEVDGYRVPRGWLTMLSPGVAHRLPEVFAEPDRFDPDRFGPDRAEDRRHPHALIGFSGGFYRCPGQAFGRREIATVVAALVTRFELTPPGHDPGHDETLGVTRPGSPYRIRFRRRVPAVR